MKFKKEDLQALLEQRPADLQKVDTTWDIKNLKALADISKCTKNIKTQNSNERKKNINSYDIKAIIICKMSK